VGENIIEKLDINLALFPLDSECNWMLDSALHPGACIVSKAVLCGGSQARQVLEWAFEEQEYLTRAASRAQTRCALRSSKSGAIRCSNASTTAKPTSA